MPDWLIELILQHKYLLIVVVAIFEGPILMPFCGAFIKLGHLSFWPSFFALMGGNLIGDTSWYLAGYFGGMRFVDRFGKYLGLNRKKVMIVSRFYHKFHNSILFISKITAGFGFAIITLITAGLVRIPFRKYILINSAGQLVFTGALIGLGYLFEHLYITISDVLGRVTLIAGFIIFIAVVISVGFRIHKNIEAGKLID